MRRLATAAVVALLVALVPPPALAQAARVLLDEGIAAYNDLEFVAASRLLRRALDAETPPALTPEEHNRALMYLGAAQFFAGNRSDAASTFRTLVVANPRYEPDRLAFPPEVSRVLDETRQTTKAVAVIAPAEQLVTPGADRYVLRLYASSRHLVRVALLSAAGDTVRALFDGTIDDSLAVEWNGLGETGETPPSGSYRLEAVSLVLPERPLRAVRVPISIARLPADTLLPPPSPPDSLFRPEHRPGGGRLAVLIPGLVASAALVVPAAAGEGGAQGFRIGLGTALALGSIIGYVKVRREQPIPENIAYNDSLRAAWNRDVLEVAQANRRLADAVRLLVRAGVPEVEGR